MQYTMLAVENRRDYEIGRVNVTDRDDRGTGNWEAKYSISNDPKRTFAVSTDPATNQGVLTVVQVQAARLTSDGQQRELKSCFIASIPDISEFFKEFFAFTRPDRTCAFLKRFFFCLF